MKEDNFFNSSYSTDMDGNFETRLIQGAYFIKHHKYGAPKLRHISLDKELAKIYWREPNQFNQNSGFKGFIEVKDIVSINSGQKFSKALTLKQQDKLSCMFTILAKKRTVELETPSEEMKELWIDSLKQLLKKMK